jgi:nicotinamidase-related amidase
MTAPAPRTALLVIDVQRHLFDAAAPPAEADAVVARINGLTARARAANAMVIFIQHETESPEMSWGSPGWALEDRLLVTDRDRFVRKTTPDAFLHTGLGALLQPLGIRHLVLCGYASDFCVDATARSAAAQGFDVTLAADAHTTHDKPHASGIAIRAQHNATLSGVDSLRAKINAVPAAQVRF